MAASLVRYFYLWKDNRLIELVQRRPTTRHRWHLGRQASAVVIWVEETPDGLRWGPGPAATFERVEQAFFRKTRPGLVRSSVDLGLDVPEELAIEIGRRASAAAQDILRNYAELNSEERQTGVLTTGLNRFSVKQADGWEAHIFVQGFSNVTKENATGADLGIVVDIRKGTDATVKSLWMQAKRDPDSVDRPLQLPRLANQLGTMRNHTHEAYGVIFTPERVYAIRADQPDERLDVSTVLIDAVQCRRGDRNERVLANTLDSSSLIEAVIIAPGTASPIAEQPTKRRHRRS